VDIARDFVGCLFSQETRVQRALNDRTLRILLAKSNDAMFLKRKGYKCGG
jgi:hypothetical protein